MYTVCRTVLAAMIITGSLVAAPNSAAGGERWLIEIQRFLDEPEHCPSQYAPGAQQFQSPVNQVRTSTLVPAGELDGVAVQSGEVSCLQATRMVRAYGFHQIEVVSCDGYGTYVYEALRGRTPWRLNVSALDGRILRAAPLY